MMLLLLEMWPWMADLGEISGLEHAPGEGQLCEVGRRIRMVIRWLGFGGIR